ncbi:hypothetical protein R5W24_004440 [Gemmata sp. JC717]|uniref:hypothetical protein n=1 Tax=Gemmata algarum TaxID=2975278 RepID=UPI0021BA5DD8|nr:hypothetical protein [Gemmata algarum]MDY3555299.1 hypothetical protein [Gemmata algarum]
MDDLQHVQPGAPLVIQANTWNRFIDAARIAEAQGQDAGGPVPVEADGWRPASVVRARNNGETTIPPHAILTPSAAVLSPVDKSLEARRRPLIDVATPASADDPIAIAFDSIAYQEIGRFVVSGVTVALVEVTDTAHRYARPVAGDRTKLVSATSGPARLLVAPTETGTERRYVLLGGGSGAGDGGGSGGTAGGCGWVAGLTADDCLEAKAFGASGRCSALTAGAAASLTTEDGATWTGALTLGGVEYAVSFTRGACGEPCATLTAPGGSGGTFKGTLESCSGSSATFAFGGGLCTGAKCGGPRRNLVRVQVRWVQCDFEEGWYCVKDCDTGETAAVELLDGAQYDDSIEIVSGPYATQEEADAACGPVTVVCCGDTPLPRQVRATISGFGGADGTYTLTYDAPNFPGIWSCWVEGSWEAGGGILQFGCRLEGGLGWGLNLYGLGPGGAGSISGPIVTDTIGGIDCNTLTGYLGYSFPGNTRTATIEAAP